VACQDTLFVPVIGNTVFDPIVPRAFDDAPVGSVLETAPAAVAMLRALASRLDRQGGVALLFDYGYAGPAIGDTLQAVRGHAFANPYDAPGEQDLTAHVDFGTLAEAARAEGMQVAGPIEQGAFLVTLGIDGRAAQLARAAPDRAEAIAADRRRLVDPEMMGALFKVMAFAPAGGAMPAGFA